MAILTSANHPDTFVRPIQSPCPVVSIVMPVYNNEKYVRAAIDSVLAQSFQDWELIVVDDASTDSTPQILAEYHDPRIRVLRNEQNRKQSFTINRGNSVARGRYLAHLDGDDISLPHRLAEEIAYLDSHPDVIMLLSAVYLIDEDGKRIGLRAGGLNACTMNFIFASQCPVLDSSLVFRASALQHVAGYDESSHYTVTEDYEFMSRFAFQFKTRVLRQPLIEYRVHASSVSQKHHELQLRQNENVARGNVQRASGMEVDDLASAAWWRFVHSPAGAATTFSPQEVGALNRLVPALIRRVKHDSDGRCVLLWLWARHALALALLPRARISFLARLRFLQLALTVAVYKLIWH